MQDKKYLAMIDFVIERHTTGAKGAFKARHQTSNLYKGETYYL